MTINGVAFLLLALATFRIGRLISFDTVTQVPRKALLRRAPWLSEFLHCPWCVSVWAGSFATVLYWQWPTTTLWLCLPFALSAIAGLLASNLDL